MNYTETRQLVEERGKTWNDFIVFMQDKPYDIDPENFYILYPKKIVYQFINQK